MRCEKCGLEEPCPACEPQGGRMGWYLLPGEKFTFEPDGSLKLGRGITVNGSPQPYVLEDK